MSVHLRIPGEGESVETSRKLTPWLRIGRALLYDAFFSSVSLFHNDGCGLRFLGTLHVFLYFYRQGLPL